MKVHELDKHAFEKAHAWYIDSVDTEQYAEHLIDEFVRDMATFGVDIENARGKPAYPCVYFQLHYRSHLVVEAQVRLDKFMKATGADETYPALYLAYIESPSRVGISVRRQCMYAEADFCYWGEPLGLFAGLDIDAWNEMLNEQETLFNPEGTVLAFVQDKCSDLLKSLEDEYDYQTSKEAFLEMAQANEWTFDENGELQ